MAGIEAQARTSALQHWPEIDGLRSIAVIPVLLFHLRRDLLSGGFVGVDVFFVISGFLITAILLEDINLQRFSLARFYQRRIARIAPAFFLVICVTLATVFFVYSAQDIASTGVNSAFAATSLANIKYMLQGNYFQISPDAQPNLHYWSLSVEEQFYLFFPLYLYAVVRWIRNALTITIGLAALSFALCVATTWLNPIWAFYLLPTRGWELFAGAAIALLRARDGPRSVQWAPLISGGGLLLIAISMFAIREDSHFPGSVVSLPVLGTALALSRAGDGGLINRILAHPILVSVGKLSYSLYLWHWPVYSIIDYQFFAIDWWYRDAAKIVLTIIATVLTYQILERPARRYLNTPKHRLVAFSAFLAACALIVAVGLQIRSNYYLDARAGDLATGGVTVEGGRRGSIVLIGDSQGAMYATELASIARSRGFTLHALAVPAGNELPGEPSTYWPRIMEFLSHHERPSVIIVSQAWDQKLSGRASALSAALRELRPLAPIILLTQPPALPADASRQGMRSGARPPFHEPNDARERRLRAGALVRTFADDRVIVVDMAPSFTNADGSIRLLDYAGRLNFQDPGHLSSFGVTTVRPLLDGAIAIAIEQQPPTSRLLPSE